MRELLVKRLRQEEGMTLVMLAVFFPVLILFVGLAIDTGNWWVHKRHLQIQADAAALAGATAYRFPGCNDDAIEQMAVRYSGGADPDHPSVDPQYNFMRDATPDDWVRMHTAIQEPRFWGDDDEPPHDEDLVDEPGPCEAEFIDVKLTEEDSRGFFARGWVPEIDAEARVSLRKMDTATGLLPIGVEDVNPVRVHVWMYDEDTSQLLGQAELAKRPEPDGTVFIWDNALGNGDALPIAVANVTSKRIGFKVALSGNEDTVTCGAPLVVCYGYGAPIPEETGKFFTRGLGRIRGHQLSGTAPRLGEVALVKPAAPPCGSNDYLDRGYFSLTCNKIDVAADLRGIAHTATVKAFIATDKKQEKQITLNWDPDLARWTGTGLQVTQLAGPLPVKITYQQDSGTLENGAVCPDAPACKGEFADAHVHFAGSRYWSGPIKHLEIQTATDSTTNVGNVERCAPDAAVPCAQSFVIRIGVGGRLELSDLDDPPIPLRIFGGGSRNQSLDCNPDEPLFEQEIADGCRAWYTINEGTPCPTPAALWKLPQPWDCVAIQTGTATSKPAKGLNTRVLCSAPNEANCSSFGKAEQCTVRNAWPNFGVPGDDTRIIPLFLVPFGSFDSQGTGSVPVLDFAYFYVTGWHGPGGFPNPCQEEVPSYEDFVEGTEEDQGVMSGHFVLPTVPNTGEGEGTEECDVESIGGCLAVLTK